MTGHHVVIVGGGFAGLHAARGLGRAPVSVTLVDRRNFHLFQPLLYQVATGGLSPGDITAPLRSVLKRRAGIRVVLAEATGFDVAGRRLLLADGEIAYDSLIVAAGASPHYFGHDEWSERAPGLKTIEDATRMRGRILQAFEAAERRSGTGGQGTAPAFVVVGGGPTGVELAGAIGELARQTLRGEFRAIEPARTRILLVEGGPRILAGYPDRLAMAAERALAGLGVEVRCGVLVTEIAPGAVTLAAGDRIERVAADEVLWAAGVRASALADALARSAGVVLDRAGRVAVAPDCSLPGHPEILVLGDMARFEHGTDGPLPGVAPVAMQQGRYAARRIRDRLSGRDSPPFRYRNRGNLAVIGRAAAVADLGRLRISGYAAWLLWLFVHIMYLVEFENRLLVFVQWAYSYFTRKRGARLITEPGGPA